MRRKVKLALIARRSARRETFKKRKRGILKKLDELTTLCDVKACAIIKGPDEPNPEVWPSPEGVEEVTSKFMELPIADRSKNMMDQATYLLKAIAKEEVKVKKLHDDIRESQLREFMFGCIEGKMKVDQCDPRDLPDLISYLNHYVTQIDCRIKHFTGRGESSSSSSVPLFPATFADADPPIAADATAVTAPVGFYEQDQQELVQHQAPLGFYGQDQQEPVQHQAPIGFYGQDQQEPVQHQAPIGFNDQIQHGIYDMNSNHNLYQNWNQYPYQQESFLNLQVEHPQQMGYVGEHAHIPFMDCHYNYHQVPTADLATTGLMPPVTTTITPAAAAGVYYAPDNNNTL